LKICILGAGALGCAIGAALSEAGHETWLLNRGRAHVEAMNLHGLRVQDERGERQVRVKAACDAATVGVADLVVVLVKSFHTREAITGAKALIGPQTLVLSLQNGLGHEDILAEAVGRERVLAGKTYVGGVLLAPAPGSPPRSATTFSAPCGTSCWSTSPLAPSAALPGSAMASCTASRCWKAPPRPRWPKPSPSPSAPVSA